MPGDKSNENEPAGAESAHPTRLKNAVSPDVFIVGDVKVYKKK